MSLCSLICDQSTPPARKQENAMKKSAVVIGVALVLVAIAYSQRANIAARVLEQGLASRLGANALAELEDGLHLALCGAGGPLPAPDASGPCVAVVAGSALYVVDAGTDGVRNLNRMG
jgi:ribonuclease Z